MKCEEIEYLMLDYLDNKLDESGKKEIERHLETCESCLDIVRESQKIMKLFSGRQMEKPDESLSINFYRMLHDEIRKTENIDKGSDKEVIKWYNNRLFLAAAGFALLICGTFIGLLINYSTSTPVQTGKIDQLQLQVEDLRKNAMFAMLKEESSSYRLKGVSYADELLSADDMVIEALLNTLNTDKNVNVRMAAAFSLSKFTDQRMVCDSLVASLPRQTDPILQITLINVLVDLREKSALRIIQQIIKNEQTLDEVRTVAENGARELML